MERPHPFPLGETPLHWVQGLFLPRIRGEPKLATVQSLPLQAQRPPCEKLGDDRCSIHETKPLVCRSYPLRYTKVGTGRVIYEAAPECKSIPVTKPKGSWAKFPELYSSEEIGYHLTQFHAMKEPKWRYDHFSETWTPYDRK